MVDDEGWELTSASPTPTSSQPEDVIWTSDWIRIQDEERDHLATYYARDRDPTGVAAQLLYVAGFEQIKDWALKHPPHPAGEDVEEAEYDLVKENPELVANHFAANEMHRRVGKCSIKMMFGIERHTVVIAGRPVQVFTHASV